MLPSSFLKNENGYLAIMGALVILTLLTVIGISASRVGITEVTMARNEVVYRRNFYLAEGAALEAADHLARYGNLEEKHQSLQAFIQKTVAGSTRSDHRTDPPVHGHDPRLPQSPDHPGHHPVGSGALPGQRDHRLVCPALALGTDLAGS